MYVLIAFVVESLCKSFRQKDFFLSLKTSGIPKISDGRTKLFWFSLILTHTDLIWAMLSFWPPTRSTIETNIFKEEHWHISNRCYISSYSLFMLEDTKSQHPFVSQHRFAMTVSKQTTSSSVVQSCHNCTGSSVSVVLEHHRSWARQEQKQKQELDRNGSS